MLRPASDVTHPDPLCRPHRNIDYHSNMKLLVTLERDETGMLVAECPAIPGCVSEGRTESEALDNIREAIAGCLATRAAHGMPATIEVREIEVPA